MDHDNPIQSTEKIQIGGVNVHGPARKGTFFEIGINQKSTTHEAAFVVIADAAKERFGARVVANIGRGWRGPHDISISYSAMDKKTGQILPPISMDDVKNLLTELAERYPTGPDLEKAARELDGSRKLGG